MQRLPLGRAYYFREKTRSWETAINKQTHDKQKYPVINGVFLF